MKMKLVTKATNLPVSQEDMQAMLKEFSSGTFEALALQDDGTPILCSKTGEFAYVDAGRFRVVLEIEEQ